MKTKRVLGYIIAFVGWMTVGAGIVKAVLILRKSITFQAVSEPIDILINALELISAAVFFPIYANLQGNPIAVIMVYGGICIGSLLVVIGHRFTPR